MAQLTDHSPGDPLRLPKAGLPCQESPSPDDDRKSQ